MYSSSPWRSRGYLPHFDTSDVWQAITYRLADSLPAHVVSGLERSLGDIPEELRNSERRRRIENWIDSGPGACLLRRTDVAQMVLDNWQRFAGERYDIGPWVIMPNHVHVMIRVNPGCTLETIVRSWKSYTAKRIMAQCGCAAPIWWNDYWDRYIRDENHWLTTKRYIEGNPLAASLVKMATDWRWSSAAVPPRSQIGVALEP